MHYLSDLWQALDFSSLRSTLLRVASVLVCLIFHEVCHGVAAFFLGDPTAKRAHRLSLNPLHHIDWLGLAAMVVTGVGWAKPVPVNPQYFKRPKLGMAVTALAGPLSNMLLSLWLLWGVKALYNHALAGGNVSMTLFQFMLSTAMLSVGLGLFNLIPIPPTAPESGRWGYRRSLFCFCSEGIRSGPEDLQSPPGLRWRGSAPRPPA